MGNKARQVGMRTGRDVERRRERKDMNERVEKIRDASRTGGYDIDHVGTWYVGFSCVEKMRGFWGIGW